MGAEPREIATGLWRWTARHPDWHPGAFGAEVASYALADGPWLVLIDPLLPDPPEPVLGLLDSLVAERVEIVVTIPYHVRSAEALWARLRGRAPTAIRGHPALARRLSDARGFEALEPGTHGPGGIGAYAIGRPRRYERPVLVASHAALAFGDAVVEVDGALRLWSQEPVDDHKARWYAERFAPTLRPLVALASERVLVTHGEPVMTGATAALAAALEAPPWHHRGPAGAER